MLYQLIIQFCGILALSSVFIFGGEFGGRNQDIFWIALSDHVVAYSENGWSRIGKLKAVSHRMATIMVDEYIYIFGGEGAWSDEENQFIPKHTEIWRVSFTLIARILMES